MSTQEDARKQLADELGLLPCLDARLDALLSDVSLLMQALGATRETNWSDRARGATVLWSSEPPDVERWVTDWAEIKDDGRSADGTSVLPQEVTDG